MKNSPCGKKTAENPPPPKKKCILPNNKYNNVYKPVVAQWIDALLANTEHQGSIPAAAMFGDKLATCPCKNTQQPKRRLDALCASNGSGGYIFICNQCMTNRRHIFLNLKDIGNKIKC